MAWVLLALAIGFEVLGTSLLKYSDGFTRILPAVGSMLSFWACFALFALAMRSIPLGVVYAIGAGMGIVLVTVIAAFWFEEPVSPLKLLFVGMILVGTVGLRL